MKTNSLFDYCCVPTNEVRPLGGRNLFINTQTNKHVRLYSTKQGLDPWFITGFTDASPLEESKALVVWGTNLRSTIGVRFTLKESGMVQLAPYQYDVIIGLMLSDGWITFSSKYSKNARIGFKQSADHASYVLFVFNLLSHYCSRSSQGTTGIRSGKQYYGLQFFTRAMPCITELYSLFYPKGVKLIPHNIYELLTPIALAHLIMGDGAVKRTGLVLCTDSYSIEDTVRLLNVLVIRYKLECTLRIYRENQYRIYIRQNSLVSLVNIVSPYMHYTMLYKVKSVLNIPRDRHKIEVLDVKYNTITAYSSMSEAAKILNIPKSAIVNYFRRNQVKSYKSRYTFDKV